MSDALAARLNALDAETLATLLARRAETDEDFGLWLEAQLAAWDARDQLTPLDPEPFRRQAEALLEPASGLRPRRHWGDSHSDVDEAALEGLIGQAEPFLAAGNGIDALAILRPVAEALVDTWPRCADWDETLHEFFPVLDALIARAALSGDIADEQRDVLVDELSDWQDQVAEHGADNAFAVALVAATLGWDEPGLSDVLNGRTNTWPLDRKDDWLNGKLIEARLAALEAMGCTEGFLNLSRAAGRHCDHAVMLAKCGRSDEALAIAHARFREPDSILRLAQTLLAMGHDGAAFEFAEWGLSLSTEEPAAHQVHSYSMLALARWLRDTARDAGRTALAIIAASVAFEKSLSREDYEAARELCSDEAWPSLRESLLARLLVADYAPERIDILLDENRIADAIAVTDRKGSGHQSPHNASLLRLARSTCHHDPDWTIRFALRLANPIMSEGRSNYYELAVDWLALAAQAHAIAGTSGQWRSHLDTLIETHRRKHKLRGLLEALRAIR